MYLNRFVRAESANIDRECSLQLEDESNAAGREARDFYERLIQHDECNVDYQSEQTAKVANNPFLNASITVKKRTPPGRSGFINPLQEDHETEKVTRLRLRQINQRIFRRKNNLFKFVNDGDIKRVKEILSLEEEWVNIRDDYGWTPMMCAIASGNICMVEFLLNMKADVYDIKDHGGQSAWDIAVKLDKSDIVELLLDRKVKKEPQDQEDGYRKVEHSVKNDSKFCEDCKVSINFNQMKDHFTSTAHLFNVYRQKESAIQYHLSANNIGYKMLKDAGWSEEKGLGRDGSGKQQPVSTVLKSDRSGLGLIGNYRKRVTHFKANDFAAIRNRANAQRSEKRLLKRKKMRKELKSKQWEICLRSYMTCD